MEEQNNSYLWLGTLLQAGDPLFPVGSYAHSYGLEGVTELGLVKDAKSLTQFIHTHVIPSLENFELPYLKLCYEAASSNNSEELYRLDKEIHALKPCKELRECSQSQGKQRLKVLLQNTEEEQLLNYDTQIKSGSCPGNHIAVFALQCSLSKIPLMAMMSSWFYQALSAFCTASLKLIKIGQMGVQKILTNCLQQLDNSINRACEIPYEEIGALNPLIDIASARHERAFSRMFIS